MYIDKFKGVVLIREDHPLADAQRAKGASAVAANTRSHGTASTSPDPIAELFALPPGQRDVTKVEAYLQTLSRRKLQAKAVELRVDPDQKRDDLVIALTFALTGTPTG